VADAKGVRWVRVSDESVAWALYDHEDTGDLESWRKVAGNYGPVRLVAP